MMMEIKELSSRLSPEEQYKILSYGAVNLINKEEFIKKLKLGRSLRVKAGFDPSRPDLHLGHLSLINKLRQFQELGHQVIFVVGDWTACIGDPSGQNKTRPILSYEEAKHNAESYIRQATGAPPANNKSPVNTLHNKQGVPQKNDKPPVNTLAKSSQEERENFKKQIEGDKAGLRALSFFKRLDPEKTKCEYNSKWLNNVSLKEFILDICSKFTVARQLERNDFSLRYKSEKPIGLHEFLYPLIQAYDSVELKADVELGGTDQLFNLLLGRELQEESGQKPQTVLTLPLLEGIDAKKSAEEIKQEAQKTENPEDRKKTENWSNIEGAYKMSKSLNNAITFNDSPKEMYGKTMKISDKLLVRWWNVFTEGRINLKPHFEDKSLHPKKEKEKLAWLLVCSFHGEEKAHKAREEFNRVFSGKGLPDQIIENQDLLSQNQELLKQNKAILKQNEELHVKLDLLIKELGLSSSLSEARRAILSGAVREGTDHKKLTNHDALIILKKGEERLFSLGRRKFRRVNLKWDYIHNLKAYFTYRKEKDNRGDKAKLCEELAQDKSFKDYISLSSIKMKIENYRYLDTGKGLSGFSLQSEEVFNKFKACSLPEIEKEISGLK